MHRHYFLHFFTILIAPRLTFATRFRTDCLALPVTGAQAGDRKAVLYERGFCYTSHVTANWITWEYAMAACQQVNEIPTQRGHLVHPTNSDVLAWILGFFINALGMYDHIYVGARNPPSAWAAIDASSSYTTNVGNVGLTDGVSDWSTGIVAPDLNVNSTSWIPFM